MSELTAQLAAHGSVDRAVIEGRLAPPRVAVHLPTCTYPIETGSTAAGWCRDLQSPVGDLYEADLTVHVPVRISEVQVEAVGIDRADLLGP